jgi:diacylglycerol kinase family enzyme
MHADPERIERLRALVPERHLVVTERPSEVEAALGELRALRIESLVVVGGDGTITGTLTPLLHVWPAASMPRIALLPGGSVNGYTRALSGNALPHETLPRLLAQHTPRECERCPLEIRAGQEPVRFGLLFGNGAVARWLEHYYGLASPGLAGAARALLGTLGAALTRGALDRRLFNAFSARIEIDGKPVPETRFSGMAAGAFSDIGLGLRVFFLADREPGRFHWLTTDAGGLRLGLDLPAAWLGRRAPGSRLRDRNAAQVRIETDAAQPYTVDGDLFPPVTRLEVSAGPTLRFWLP